MGHVFFMKRALPRNFFLARRVYLSMASYISFRVFLVCLVSCALLALGGIWLRIDAPLYFQTTASMFVIGLASFLVWFSLTLLAIRKSVVNRVATI